MDVQPADSIFRDNLAELGQDNCLVARVPGGIATRDHLFAVLRRGLDLPSYFGANWDALSECLCDLSWIDRHRVIIAHEAVPDLDAVTLRVYLQVLAECAKDWKPDEQHQLLVVFPERAQTEIRRIIDEGSAQP